MENKGIGFKKGLPSATGGVGLGVARTVITAMVTLAGVILVWRLGRYMGIFPSFAEETYAVVIRAA